MASIELFFKNKWVKFTIVSVLYLLWFVVWMRNPWFLFGLPLIFDLYISKYFNRYVWSKHRKLKKEKKVYKKIFEWVDAIVFATIAASLIRLFFFEMYVIPTSSMEKTLLVGDHLYVSKTAYGPKMPNTPISFPFVHNAMPFSKGMKKSYNEAIKQDYKRLKGFRQVKRGDIVVFNFPAGDTVLLERQNITYYDVLAEYQMNYGEKRGREMLNEHYTVVSRPIDKRENYVKRCVGIPGDKLEIKDRVLYVNGEVEEAHLNKQHIYFVQTNGTPISYATLETLRVAKDDIAYNQQDKYYVLPLTDAARVSIEKLPNVDKVTPYRMQVSDITVFPNDTTYNWTSDFFGPLSVPAKGETITLTIENLPIYKRIIKNYELNKLGVNGDVIYINGEIANSYTFAMDYYFMMGDNRHNSADSRFWGFVPEDHIVGQPNFLWLSLNKDKSFPGNIRWNRFFKDAKK